MPSHVKPGGCGTIVRGDGFLLTEVDVEANAEADRLAKRGVEEHRAPLLTRREIKEHDDLTTANAMWIARATLTANNQDDDPKRDTEASKAKAAAAAAKRHSNYPANPGQHPTYNPSTGKQCSTRVREPNKGGHTLARRDGGWHCKSCRKRSMTWSKLAPPALHGPPGRNLGPKSPQARPHDRYDRQETPHRGK